ncbi:uncharacterized protein LOC115219379 [Octopus sinensis]|uniref:Uncharacterized protein LOC115219379 n=1 Tax=Octopus sinensis TaxID=2607531 RepID=A0A7E6FEG1_9MOLL|nr:uncharacterized protein LOC115219379 [Octopus sinensis]
MFLSLSIVLSLVQCVLTIDLTYHVEEERSPGTYVADIAADSKLLDNVKPSDQHLITFSQFKRKVAQLFNITKTGKLYTAQTLDAEDLCTFNKECSRTMKVIIKKVDSFTKILKVKIIIEDINDHQPKFPIKNINIQFSENIAKGAKQSIPNAMDKDVGFQNSLAQYELKSKNGEPFSLSVSKRVDGISSLKIVLKETLDREIKDTYLLQVIAKDGGSPAKQGILNINISIIDENDNPPVFSKPLYNVSIQSTHHKAKPIIVLSVSDADSGENGKITFHFSPKTSDFAKSYFEVNENSGTILLSKYTSLGKKKTYELFIEARDGGNPPLSSIATVLVNVINQHNNPPSIDIDYISAINDNTATISENIKVGSFIAYVMVTDNDVGQNGEVSCDIKHDTFKLQSTGSKEYQIILNKPVDRETQGHYNIPVSCQDKGLPPLKSVKSLSIQVTDINDVQPQFTKDTFQFLTYENKDKDFPIGFVNATDPDLGSAGQLTYSLLRKEKSNLPFLITSYGFISATMSLDREKQDVYKFEVFVKDNGSPSLNDTANVVVEILDQNDNAPYFTYPSSDPYTLNVQYHPQSKSDITVLRASDEDSGNNAFLRYAIIQGNDKQLFSMNSHSGALSFSRQVHLNDAGSYELVFVVKDSGSPVQSSTTSVTLVLAVSNETSPMSKSGPLQSSGQVHMTWVIIIVSSAVIISVAIVVSIKLCIMQCIKHRDNTAAATKNTAYQGRAEMKQLLYQTNTSVAMSRTLPKPTPKYCQPVVVTSSDDAVEDNATMVCNYTSDTMSSKRSGRQGDLKHYEEIPGVSDKPGQLHLNTMLLSLSIVLSMVHCVLTIDLTYHVEEERSPGTYVADIAADSKLLDNVKPSDQHLITFSQFKRKVAQLFNITKTGKLYTAQTLDAEDLCTFNKECSRTMKVVVNKGISVSKILKIKIVIEDINDHQPEFPIKNVNIQFGEDDRISSKRSIPNAMDKDVGFQNSLIQYKLKSKNGEPFSLSVSKRADGISSLKIVLKESLDREIKDTYLLQVIAKDGGSPAKQGILNINISIIDLNDNPPVFSKPLYNISIQSTHHKSKPIIVLSVTDADSGENGKITFHFSPKTSDLAKSYFQLNKTSGNILLREYSNLGKKKTYELFVEARDGGIPPLNSIATVLVNVINQHNNPPNIDIDYVSAINDNTATISENIKVGSFIAYVMVTDNDVGQNGEVSCDIKHDTFKLQSMGSKEYKIILNKPVDRETQGHYNIPVSCQDKGLPPLKSVKSLSIQVTDINDVQPQFTKDTFQFLTYENKDKDFPIGFVNATDPDLGSAGQLTYSLLRKEKSNLPFLITSYGFISATMSLDREKQDVYKFEVFVKDNGSPSLNDTANVVVEILDQNDNAPYFTYPSSDPYTLNVQYHPQSKSDITVLRASDGDSGNNAFLRYAIIQGNDKQLFSMNSHSGALSFSRQVYLNDAGSYELVFVVKDSGSPVQSSTTSVTLVLAVSNETSPMSKSGPLQSSGRVHMTWVIIIVSSAVIISVAIVVSITLCIMKCIKHRDNTAAATKNTAYQGRAEMKQLLYQTNTSVAMSRNAEEMVKRNIYSERSKSECYAEGQLQNKYESSVQSRTLPKPTPKYCQPVVVTSSDDAVEDNATMVCNYTSDTMSSKRSGRHGELKHYEEIPGISDNINEKSQHSCDSLQIFSLKYFFIIDCLFVRNSDSNHFHILNYLKETYFHFRFNQCHTFRYLTIPTLNSNMFLPLSIVFSLVQCVLTIDLTYHVEEERSPGTYVADIAADSKLLDNVKPSDQHLITFSQFKRKVAQLFNITKTGKLYTAQTLDAEDLCTFNKECSRTVKVVVNKGRSITKILKIKIVIEDINDHQPNFPMRNVNILFSEDDRKGAKRSIPNAIDKDVGFQNSLIQYKLKSKNGEPFSLSVSKRADGISSLKIVLKETLDREIKDTYLLQVIAKDGGSPAKQGILNINISVIDVNDNPPEFSKPLYNISIQSAHHKSKPIIVLSVTDADSGENGKITFHFSPKTSDIAKSYFQLNETSGNIQLREYSNFGKKKTYELFIEARDGGNPPLISIATVLVNVINQHNNPPSIDIDYVSSINDNTATLSEDTRVGSFIAYVMVTDNDVGQNGEVSCDIKHDTFKLQSMGSKEYKIILNKPVDRETQGHYNIPVSCQDKGLPPLKSVKSLSIQVTDINDVQPQFTKDTFQFLTYENKDKDFPIGFVNATDPDLGSAGQLTYSLLRKEKSNLPFLITSYGFISATMSLDREKQDVYKFEVFVKDNGSPSLNDTANVVVEILDQNDNAPYFTYPSSDPYTLNVQYHPQSKSDITVLRASDGDSGNNAFLRYAIIQGNDKQLFSMNSHSGALSFSRQVYLNDAGSYGLVFVVKDSGSPVQSSTTSVTLVLAVSNETSPMSKSGPLQSSGRVHMTWVIIIVSSAVIISVAIVVSITLCIMKCIKHRDNTAAATKNTAYQGRAEMKQLLYQTNTSVAMSRNAEEMVKRNIYSERSKSECYAEGQLQNKYESSVQSRTLPKPTPWTLFLENSWSHVMSSTNSQLTCLSSSNYPHCTQHYTSTALITIAIHFSFEVPTLNSNMLLSLSIVLSVVHCVLTIDLTYHVEEERSPGTYVADIAADSKLLDNVKPSDQHLITFSQFKRKVAQLFNITKTGKLYTAQTLDAEDLCTFNKECSRTMKVVVNKGRSITKILKIKIVIEDINDHEPKFPKTIVYIEFGENDRKGSKVSLPNAIDKDVGFQNSLIQYKLKSKNGEPFSLSVSKRADGISSLKIVLKESLDREIKDTYLLQVIAKDGGSPAKQGILNINISIIDLNDNPPVFSKPLYNISLQSTHHKSKPIIVLSVTDADSGENGKITFHFSPKTSDIAKSYFQLNETSGGILLSKYSSLGKKKTYELFIEARDGGSPPLSSIATVLVNVINQHNNPPSIDIDYVSSVNDNTATISEDTRVGSFIAYVMVTDNDVGQNGEVSCDIKHDTFKLQSMGSKEYKIILNKPVDRETQGHYNIPVSCQDKGLPPLKSVKSLSIQVTDINDVQPQFTKDTFQFLTYENKDKDFPIGFVNATDPDLGSAGQLTYSLLRKEKSNLPFLITSYGFISATMSLDREKQDVYKFEVFVKDNGSPSLNDTANVVVEILDQNDNAPYFTYPSSDPYTLNVQYHPQSKSDITVLRASDGDSGNNAFLRYAIIQGNDKQLFSMNSHSGALSFSRQVYLNDAGSYELVFVVKDSGSPVQSSTTSVTLVLAVSNETSPMSKSGPLQSSGRVHMTWVIIIVSSAVIISVAIVVSITLCIMKCIKHRDNTAAATKNTAYQGRAEMKQLLYQTNTSVAMSRNAEEMVKRNIYSERSKSECYAEGQLQNKYESSVQSRTLPKPTPKYCQPVVVTSSDDAVEDNATMVCNYTSDTMSSKRSGRQGDLKHYEEIPGVSETIMKGEALPTYNSNMLLSLSIVLSMVQCVLTIDLTYHVEEERSPGTYVADIAADSKLLDNVKPSDQHLITFSQFKRKVAQLFNITKTGKLYTAQTLDAEDLCTFNKECSRTMKVVVNKGTSVSKILKIKIVIEDINDHEPKFPKNTVYLEYGEDDRKGAKRSLPNAIDKDVGFQNSLIQYKLKSKNGEPFSLSVSKRADGISSLNIVLKESLDREIKDTYLLQVTAKDGGSPAKQGILNINISIMDVNDNLPEFSKPLYNISIQSTHHKSKPIIVLSVTDADAGENGKITFHFSPKTSDIVKSYFQLNETSGSILLRKYSSLGKKKTYELFIEARDGGSPPFSSIATVLVNVVNQHNNPPNIDIDYVSAINDNTATISENIKVGSFIAYVMVTDNDVGQNGEVSCDIKHDTFKLQSMGSKEYKIILNKPVDRETQGHYNIPVSCQDKGLPPLKSVKSLSIQVTDINDVQPQFTKDTFQFLTYENKDKDFPIGFVNATDPDLGSAGQLTYSLLRKEKSNLPFLITSYGFISATMSLDREKQDVYKFEVFVKDNGSPSLNDTANVVVEILDQNDNAPYFTYPSSDPYTLNVQYHPQSKSDITVLRASDGDSGNNAFLRYAIIQGNDKQLLVDSGSPVQSSTTSVTLVLAVSNETSPMSKSGPLQSSGRVHMTWVIIIVSSAVIISVAIVVSITLCIMKCIKHRDNTAAATKNTAYQGRAEMKQLLYQTNTSVAMSRNAEEMVKRNIYSERSKSECYAEGQLQNKYESSVQSRTLPKPTPKYCQPVVVTSSDDAVEDNATMVCNYTSDTMSSKRSGRQGDLKHYEEIPGVSEIKIEVNFIINKQCFPIQTENNSSAGKALCSDIFYNILPTINMFLSLSIVLSLVHCVLTIDLTYHVEEERSPGTYVADIAADSKLLDNVKPSDQHLITFSQFKRKVAQLFNITKTGKLYTAQTLDAEDLCTFNKECSRIMKVVVNKGTSVSKILKIKIVIEDINDHEPKFPKAQISLKFYETDGKGTKQSLPNAIDKDVGFENSLIQYKLKSKNGEPFSLSVSKRADGISSLKIVLKESLDREIKDTYLLQVIAKDGGSPAKQGILNINISIIDLNDNSPVFSKPLYNISLQSTHHKAKPIIVLSVTDADSGENGKITFHFSPKTSDLAKSYFEVNENSGSILLSKYTSLGKKKTYELFIEARDGGSPPLSSIATVLVNVINQHNNPPSIDIDYVSAINDNTATISENIKVGSFIAYVMVTDNDVGQNGEVSCDIKHDTFKLQSMGSKEYKIILNKPVDRETQGHYNIPVSCQDKGLPPLKSVKSLSIQVTDINDVQPQFTKDTFQFLTYENKDKDFPIGFVNATDPDLGSAGQLTYSLLRKEKSNLPFLITSYGFISATMSLDREKQDVYKFEVFVKDNGSPSLNDTANVVVEILDQNDNAPYFTYPSSDPYTLNVQYHPQSKSDITVLRASDGDSGNNAFLRYAIIRGNDKQLFSMNSHSGALSFSRQVYLNDAGSYELVFVVKDSGSPVQSSTTSVTLVLAVSNETSPMSKSGPLQSSGRVHMTWVIIIVSSAVIISVAIVVSITLCIMKCIKHRDNTAVATKNTAYQGRAEMKQLLYQTNTSVAMSRNAEEMVKRNIYSERSKSECYAEGQLQNKYESSVQSRTLPKPTPKYCQPVVVTSSDDAVEDNATMVCNYTSDTMSSKRSGRHGDLKHYEEIPGVSDQSIYKNNDTATSKDSSEETPVKHV